MAAKTTRVKVQRKSNTPAPITKQKFDPITENQTKAQIAWKQGQNLMLIGSAGTGKTFSALNYALDSLNASEDYKKIIIIRSSVSTRDPGFLPGTLGEKAKIYELPYFPIVAQLYGAENAYSSLKAKGMIEFSLSAFLRGITFDDCIVIVDEIQNMHYGELGTIITRIGVNARIIMCGDTKQDDLTSERFKETSGLREFMQIISKMKQFSVVNFTHDDIVRSELVRDFIIARDEFELAA